MAKKNKQISKHEQLRRLYQKVGALGGLRTVVGKDGKTNVLIPVRRNSYKIMELDLPAPVIPSPIADAMKQIEASEKETPNVSI